jgi:hypothetical protein
VPEVGTARQRIDAKAARPGSVLWWNLGYVDTFQTP